jgi:hypothetical protein
LSILLISSTDMGGAADSPRYAESACTSFSFCCQPWSRQWQLTESFISWMAFAISGVLGVDNLELNSDNQHWHLLAITNQTGAT